MNPGRVLSFQGARGGVGTTTLACCFGRLLARQRPDLTVVLVDLAVPSLSPVPAWMRAEGKVRTLSELAELPGKRSRSLLQGYFPRSPEGLLLVTAGADLGSSRPAADPSLLRHLTNWADWVLLDLSPLSAQEQAPWREASNGSLLVVDDDPASLIALPRWEKRLLAEHLDLSTCRIGRNRAGSGPAPVFNGSSTPSLVIQDLGRDLALDLMEAPELPSRIMTAFQPALDLHLSPTTPWRRNDSNSSRDAVPSPDVPGDAHLERVRDLHQRLLDRLKAEGVLTGGSGIGGADRASLESRSRESLERFVQDLEIQDRNARQVLVSDTLKLAFGLGPLEPLLEDEKVTEVMVNGPRDIFVEKAGRLHKSNVRFLDDTQLRTVIERILAPLGRRIDESQPTVDARLPDGSRVNAVIPPLSLDGPILTIRKFSKKRLEVADLVSFGTLTPEASEFLGACVRSRRNIVVSGGTGSGKTTLLNVLSGFIPTGERIVTIEDSAELRLAQEHVVRLESRPANLEGKGKVSIRDLVVNALRMRPDRIVVGEVRAGEALDMLQAMNTGHDGSLTTVHANSPRDALSRLETMCLMAGLELPLRAVREQVARAVHLIVQQSRQSDGQRVVTHISEVQGMDGDVILLQDLYTWEKGKGLVRRPFTPTFLKDLESHGYHLPVPESSFS